jgi:hypothetical protein
VQRRRRHVGGVVAQKPLLERTSALQVTFLACAIGAVACLPYAPALIGELGRAKSSARRPRLRESTSLAA